MLIIFAYDYDDDCWNCELPHVGTRMCVHDVMLHEVPARGGRVLELSRVVWPFDYE